MTVWVVRHGRTEANATGRLLGRADPALDDVGRRQASALASALPAAVRVVSSPLRRCRETAAAIVGGRNDGSGVEVDQRLVELDYGELDLVPLSEVPADVWVQWRSDPGFRPPGGETLLELFDRVAEVLEEVVSDARSGQVVLVTHVSPIKAALAWALGVGMEVSWRAFVAPASITRIEMGERGPSLHGFNAVTHLDP